ncbi:MAG: glycosyltransferase [Ignavibacteria bacterium]|nr:glycosyltransferase [Ignavibacteria bacterium]
MKKVAIISTGHPPFDERIFDKIGKSLQKFGFQVSIIVTTSKIETEIEGIKIFGKTFETNKSNSRKKISFILKQLRTINPELIICSEPFPVIVSFIFTLIQKKKSPAKIIYDVTEWYPENIYLKRNGIRKFILFAIGHLINFLSTNLSDYLFIGEETKVLRYRKYSPRKRYSIISYYPVIEFYNSSTRRVINNELIFGYAGVISVSRGLEIFYKILAELKNQIPEYQFGFILAGRFENENEKIFLEKFPKLKINFEYHEWTDYKNFSKFLEPAHICFDIRPPNKIYERSLPIKIFDYMALGKCIVASNYEPIRKIFEIAKCGVMVNPTDFQDMMNKIVELIQNPDLVFEYGVNGRLAVEKFFNWNICEAELIRAIKLLNLYD